MTIKSKEEFEYKNSLLGLIMGFISVAISIGIREEINRYISNNYLWRFGNKSIQEKNKNIIGHKTILKKQKSFNQLCHYRRQKFSYLRSWKT